MRVHRLAVTAFGPFAGTEEVDFDALSAAGLFLLHGPTGAGKTSVLDAICFALFGAVPGGRAGVTRLRSDHAGAAVAPQVVCEFSAAGRRWEVTRSPAWERPKRRGTGTTIEQARVLVRELREGTWHPVTARTDEAGLLLEDALGLGLDQFTKLVLLPQGEFAAFLRADAETRRVLLERLFGSDRFTSVQQWVRERHGQARLAAEAARADLDRLLARADQVAGAVGVHAGGAVPDTPDADPTDDPPADPAGDATGAPEVVLAALRREVSARAEDALARREAAVSTARQAAAAHRAGVLLAERQAEAAQLDQRRAVLADRAVAHRERTERIAAARHATALAPLAGPLAAARARHDVAVDAHDRAQDAVDAALGTDPDDGLFAAPRTDEELRAAAVQARELVGRLAEAQQEAARAAELDRALAHAQELVATRAAAAATATQEVAAARAGHEEVRGRRERAAVRAAELPAARAAAGSAATVARAWLDLDELRGRVDRAGRDLSDARARYDDARSAWLDLRERRLDQLAAELAVGLEPGQACPVCGSAEHPRVAVAQPRDDGGTDVPTEDAARQATELAAAAASQLNVELAGLRARLDAARAATLGRDREQALAELAAATARVAELDRAAADVRDLDRALHRAGARVEAAAAAESTAGTYLDAAREALTRAQERRVSLRSRQDAVRGGATSLRAGRSGAERTAAACDALLAARQELRASAAQLDVITAAARRAAADGGFAGLEAGLAAALDPQELAAVEAEVRAHDDEAAAVADRAADPLLAAAAAQPAPPLAALASRQELAQADAEAAADRLALLTGAAQSLLELERLVAEHCRRSAPVHAEHRTLTDLSRCLDGTGGDNARRMSLSAYVLAARLEQVAEAATVRLADMSGGRYSLVHSADPVRGRGRSGLSLQVADGWTGRVRDTATLSGGESFYTSLALALGLADVVTAEAGGRTIETLFVDEGFGSLDEETLDEVMDVLDGLRSGGRAVGLVSHVPDLRRRIPARLEVRRGREGSTLRLAAG